MINVVYQDLLENRLKSLVVALRVAEYESDQIAASSLELNDGFLSFSQSSNYKPDILEIKTDKFNFLLAEDKYKRRLKLNIPILYESQILKNEIDWQYHNIHNTMITEWLKYWNLIIINPALEQIVNEFINKNNLLNAVGINIRNTNKYYNFERFILEIEKLSDNTSFFISYDNTEEYKKYLNYFKDRIVSFSPWIERPKDESTKRGFYIKLMDMLILSKCSTLIGEFCNNFTECAWWLGKCSAKVIIPQNHIIEEAYKNYYKKFS
jgi:hypothetical protein